MEYLNSIFISIFQAVMLIIVAKIIANVKFYLRDYLAVAGIIVPSAVLFVVFGRQSIIFLLIICLIYFYVKIGFYSIIAILGSALIMYISNFFSVSLIILIGNFIKFRIIYVIISLSSYILIGVLCAFMTKYLINKLKKTYLFFNKVYIIVISTFLTFTIAIFYLYSLKFQQTYQEWKLFALLFIGILIFLAIFIIVITFSVHREMQYKRNLKEIETYYEYTLQIESINNEMRKFRHDYVNILSTMSEYIREDDMPGLREYFNNNIVSMKDNLQMNSIKINGTDKLKVRAIKGLVTTKILQAQEKNIPISIEVPELIEHIEMNTVDLSRVIGIIIDNAIEASESLEDALIRIAFIKNEDSVLFIVMNKCSDTTPKIHELFQENFSTKGKNRGLGLSNLKEIIDATPNTLLDTTIDNGYFIQKVEILNNIP
ncbi:GHKL domain-containing protein [Staphylococcus lugdunensis]|uniref:GHKL domain-containing protein n=3 Tax=Staphylococcus lugdunensis TaxID=28035 RepID=A0A4Q9W8X7_STALU|nr:MULTISPECIES: GHKL domain-containing protein [Staphylococcus]AMG62532.1 histidine kinase [Staphylococcus lugdunensis]ARJ11065.1 ATP-binding protein [Staphylococcus lugdunensis]ATG68482.1 GHKL domain-containing protein [Staphylococcus lugdunensis]ATN16030.1 GHKL domain-containing protein [Staphylococcus lugdunensis]EFU83104.1 ATPase/histidine kinase/DNA gyrase B/HSP90 domain protein [Staphylococcus lugdunensis M23590]